MTPSKRRTARWPLRPAGAWQRAARRFRASRGRVAARDAELLVLHSDGQLFRAAHVRRRERQLEALALVRGELATCLELLRARDSSAPVVLVAHDARPELVQPADRAAFDPWIAARLAAPARARWSAALAAHGLELGAVYPLAGSVLGALEGGETARCVQVERGLVAVMELVRGRCAALELFEEGTPTPRRLQELVGAACPEVLLAGGGADLSELGYALARGGTTWVRLLRPHGVAGLGGGSAPEVTHAALATLTGAARHALGLAPHVRLVPDGGGGRVARR